MKKIVSYIYSHTPPKLKLALGKSKLLKPLRDFAFRKNDSYRELKTVVKKKYKGHSVNFKFYASIQVATKASTKGIENTLLKNSIYILNKTKPNRNKDLKIFDIGANFGFLSLVWASTVASKGKVYSFEPHKEVYKSFLKSITANKLRETIYVENCAVGNANKEVEINMNSASSNMLQTSSAYKSNPSARINMITIDYYIEKNEINDCDLIKIDVDGIELDILKGAKHSIQSFKPIVIVELNGEKEIIDFMQNLGYKVLDMKLKPYKNESPLPPNAFFVPTNQFVH